jgi:hypothetical protein
VQQGTFFDDTRLTIQQRFEAFHEAHPDVYDLFVRIARQMRDKGHARYSADGILHVIRWHYATSSSGESPKINNIWSSRYARLLMEEDATFVGFFETRRLKAE